MKTYKRWSKLTNGTHVIKVHIAGDDLYIPIPEEELAVSVITVISPTGSHMGHVTPRHLVRLGNANWATPAAKHLTDALQIEMDKANKAAIDELKAWNDESLPAT
jgi:hypothetical protein